MPDVRVRLAKDSGLMTEAIHLAEVTRKQMSENNSEILSIHEVAANLRCSKAHVYNAINGKITGVTRLPAICMGRRKLVRRASLENWKQANEAGVLNHYVHQDSAVGR